MFYLVETAAQYEELKHVLEEEEVYVKVVKLNDNFHPNVNEISLIYFRGLSAEKGYIVGVKHSELVNTINIEELLEFIYLFPGKIWVSNKKDMMYFIRKYDNIYDVNFLRNEVFKVKNKCYDYFYREYPDLPHVNELIPISKHYEMCEEEFENVRDDISQYHEKDKMFHINNNLLTEVFFNIERQGIKLDRENFINHYSELPNPQFNIQSGRIYTHYNLYTTTGRPSNSYNNINFAALSKTNGERQSFTAENDCLIEMDIRGYHPRIIGELVGFKFPEDDVYSYLSQVLNEKNVKELVFQQIYGGIRKEYQSKPFFSDVSRYVKDLWEAFQAQDGYNAPLRRFTKSIKDNNPQKLFNYLIQCYETYNNVLILKNILELLKDKKTKLILYTYDAFLFDYHEEDNILENIKKFIKYPVKIKKGKNYDSLEEIQVLKDQ